jgi:hypothetical protein
MIDYKHIVAKILANGIIAILVGAIAALLVVIVIFVVGGFKSSAPQYDKDIQARFDVVGHIKGGNSGTDIIKDEETGKLYFRANYTDNITPVLDK